MRLSRLAKLRPRLSRALLTSLPFSATRLGNTFIEDVLDE